MHDSVLNDENIGWPSYVDFLTSFAFVLIMFVTWSINLIAGVENEQKIHKSLEEKKSHFVEKGFKAVIVGHELHISLENQVSFKSSHAELDDRSRHQLAEAGRIIATYPDVKWIIVKGYSDKVRDPNDEFFNWTLSAKRALAVLRFFYDCKDCNYKTEEIRRKLVLYGTGDQESKDLTDAERSTGIAGDRRVDIILRNEDVLRP